VIKANDRAEIRFPVSADRAGTARFQIAATTGIFRTRRKSLCRLDSGDDRSVRDLRHDGENGAILQPVKAPSDVYAQFGGLEVRRVRRSCRN
jgi:hypothetical protein